MIARHRARIVAIALLAALAMPRVVTAQTGAKPNEPAGDSEERLREAKALFKEGNYVRKAGDTQGALEYYLRSRKLVPSMQNTTNAAVCLEDLGRLDEALELYEEVLTKFREELSETEQQDLSASMANLRRGLGSIDVSGNVGGMLLVDGRVRGTLPLVAAVRVLPGRHAVRVLREGWEPYESTVFVSRGETIPIDVVQKVLAQAGRLRIVSENVNGAELVLDGAPLGQLPWEGTLAPGRHLFSVRKGELGTGPIVATVIEGQTVTVQVEGVPVVAEVKVAAEPMTADLSIDGVEVGKGPWRGPLPIGEHVFEAREIGYVTARLARTEARGTPPDVVLTLHIDRTHPRWAIPGHVPGILRLELFGGFAFAGSLGSDAEKRCAGGRCTSTPLATGGLLGVRGAYVTPAGPFVELETGYVSVQRGLTRTADDSFTIRSTSMTVPVTYQFEDSMRLAGPFLGAGGGYVHTLFKNVQLSGALDLGLAVLTARDALRGSASDGTRTLDLAIDQSGAPARSVTLFVQPEVRLKWDLGPLDASVALGVLIFPVDGPRYPTGEAQVAGGSCADHPGGVDCAPGRNLVAAERAHSAFVLFTPMLAVGRAF